MAHFAEIEDGIVVRVLVVDDEDEANGAELLATLKGGTWVQTSYNTRGGVHKLDGTPLRKNYAGRGYSWREDLDAFVPPRGFDSWHLDTETCLWEPPTAMPDDGKLYLWHEDNLEWVEVDKPARPPMPDDGKDYVWDLDILDWKEVEEPTGGD